MTWSERDAYLHWCHLWGQHLHGCKFVRVVVQDDGYTANNRSDDDDKLSWSRVFTVGLRLRSDLFALEEELHSKAERTVRINSHGRCVIGAPAEWVHSFAQHAPNTPITLLRRLFAIRGVYAVYRKAGQFGAASAGAEHARLSPHDYMRLRNPRDALSYDTIIYNPELWVSAKRGHPKLCSLRQYEADIERGAETWPSTQSVASYWLCHSRSRHHHSSFVDGSNLDINETRYAWVTDTELALFSHVIGTFEASRVLLCGLASATATEEAFHAMPSPIYEIDYGVALKIHRMPIAPELINTPILTWVRRGYSAYATMVWRVYHLHELMQWARAINDGPLCYFVQLLIDSHLPLWSYTQTHRVYDDNSLLFTRVAGWCAPPASKHPLSPENLAERTRQLGGFFTAAASTESLQIKVERTPYELYYPACIGVSHCWESAPDLSALVIRGHGAIFSETNELSLLDKLTRTVFEKLLPQRWKSRSETQMAEGLIAVNPNTAYVLLECVRTGAFGNIPDARYAIRVRPQFHTRLRLWLSFQEIACHARSGSLEKVTEFMEQYRFLNSFMLREILDATIERLPAVRQALDKIFPYNLWAGFVLTGANSWRQRSDWLPVLDGSKEAETALQLHLSEAESLLKQLHKISIDHCHMSGTNVPFASVFLEWMTSHVYQRIRNQLPSLVKSQRSYLKSIETRNNSEAPAELGEKQTDDDNDESEDAPPEEPSYYDDDDDDNDLDEEGGGGTGGLEGGADDDEDESGGEDDDDETPSLLPSSTGRRAHEVKILRDTSNAMLLTMGNTPSGYNDELLRELAWRVAQESSPTWLPTYFLSQLGVADGSLHLFRQWMFYYNCCDLPMDHYHQQIRQLWVSQPQCFSVLWRYLFYYSTYRSQRRIPLTRAIAQKQWLGRHDALGFTPSDDKDTEARQLIFYYCETCSAWAHPTKPCTHLTYFKNGDRFLDPMDIVKAKSFATADCVSGQAPQRDTDEIIVRAPLGLYGAVPTAAAYNGTGKTLGIHALNARGSGTGPVTTACARGETTKEHASGTVKTQYNPLSGRRRCSRNQSKYTALVLRRAALNPCLSACDTDNDATKQARAEFHSQFFKCVLETRKRNYEAKKKEKPRVFWDPDDPRYTAGSTARVEATRNKIRAYLDALLQEDLRRVPASATRARRCGEDVHAHNLCGYAVTIKNRVYTACAACGSLIIADAHRYVPNWGFVCTTHGFTALGWDSQTGNYLSAPGVLSQQKTTMELVTGPGATRLHPVLWITRGTQAAAIPLPWLVTHGAASFQDFVEMSIWPVQWRAHRDARVRQDLLRIRARVIPHPSAILSPLVEQLQQRPFGSAARPHKHLQCDLCDENCCHAVTILISAGTKRLCLHHAKPFILLKCALCNAQILPWFPRVSTLITADSRRPLCAHCTNKTQALTVQSSSSK